MGPKDIHKSRRAQAMCYTLAMQSGICAVDLYNVFILSFSAMRLAHFQVCIEKQLFRKVMLIF